MLPCRQSQSLSTQIGLLFFSFFGTSIQP
uniref:Uncharacterized protein n=1 Tax=Rhizophora mucronata TaxID=61149 RepID=A0A2P2IM74_RHIMU